MIIKKNLDLIKKPIILWFLFFIYSLIVGLFFLEYIIPNISSLHMKGWKLTPDSSYFNLIALNLAQKIDLKGWSYWELYPADGASGATSLLAIFYVFFGENHAIAIFLNAIFHALSGVIIYLIGLRVLPTNRFKANIALIASSLFIAFPSAMTWVGQIQKDSFLNAGIYLALFTILKIFSPMESRTEILRYTFIAILSLIIIASIKPYFLQILSVTLVLIIFLQVCRLLPFNFLKFCALCIYLCSIIFASSQITRHHSLPWLSGDSYSSNNKINFLQEEPNYLPEISKIKISTSSADSNSSSVEKNIFLWEKSKYLPKIFERKLNNLLSTRASLISFGIANKAKSMIDIEQKPSSATELLNYMPRAFLISFLAPFPDRWLQSQTLVSYISSIEMLFCYIVFIGLFFIILQKFPYQILICLCFAFVPLLIYGIAIPNIGTLYRIRYPFEIILLLLGFSGWSFMFDRISSKKIICSFKECLK
ncbi:hypothetical protein FIT61_02770 [Candidatus Methylopumilus rimovensis]|uniref:Uncharacterized protein n=1 Tax=Candidatus Methylopumilus rimovensis TaxID=2588535 RepID=A0AAE6FST0_9PROT|nr:hypothetical protein [Candidatus Methylopumilus rimovensis]QDD13383.1 hypothetical protein FIT61_02770 [Candidatus Methylopumilus rimovensis]